MIRTLISLVSTCGRLAPPGLCPRRRRGSVPVVPAVLVRGLSRAGSLRVTMRDANGACYDSVSFEPAYHDGDAADRAGTDADMPTKLGLAHASG